MIYHSSKLNRHHFVLPEDTPAPVHKMASLLKLNKSMKLMIDIAFKAPEKRAATLAR